jgi:hypothetical protein
MFDSSCMVTCAGTVKNLRRILLNALTALSLILFAAVVALWVRSYWASDELGYISGGGIVSISNPRGHLAIFVDSPVSGHGFTHLSRLPVHLDRDLPAPDSQWGPFRVWFNFDRLIAAAPAWLCALAFAVLPLTRFAGRFRKRRPAPGLCPECGYDLRATPERCPECGTIPAK